MSYNSQQESKIRDSITILNAQTTYLHSPAFAKSSAGKQVCKYVVWGGSKVIMPAKKISLKNAKKDKLFYFVANVVVYRENDGRCLILKRSEKEKVHPGKYCVPGGKLEWAQLDIKKPTRLNGDVLDFEGAVEDLLARETLEEAGIEIKNDLRYINSVAFVRPDEIPVVLVKFAAKYKSGKVKIESDAFSGYAWVNEAEVKNYKCIKGIPEEIIHTIKVYGKDKK